VLARVGVGKGGTPTPTLDRARASSLGLSRPPHLTIGALPSPPTTKRQRAHKPLVVRDHHSRAPFPSAGAHKPRRRERKKPRTSPLARAKKPTSPSRERLRAPPPSFPQPLASASASRLSGRRRGRAGITHGRTNKAFCNRVRAPVAAAAAPCAPSGRRLVPLLLLLRLPPKRNHGPRRGRGRVRARPRVRQQLRRQRRRPRRPRRHRRAAALARAGGGRRHHGNDADDAVGGGRDSKPPGVGAPARWCCRRCCWWRRRKQPAGLDHARPAGCGGDGDDDCHPSSHGGVGGLGADDPAACRSGGQP
jgi:hypothetical protein